MRRALLAATAAIALNMSGCNKPSTGSSTSTTAPAQASASNNDAAAQSRKSATIAGVPLVFSIPADWKSIPPITQGYLQGPGPAGQITVAVSILDFMDDFRRRLFVNSALDEAQKHPYRIHASQSTTAGGLEFVEKISYIDLPTDPPGGLPPATQPSQHLFWAITIFVPYQSRFIPCNLELANITQQQFDADKPIIETIATTAQAGELPRFQ
jgi:hypothetical protein